jgi:mannosyltransferase
MAIPRIEKSQRDDGAAQPDSFHSASRISVFSLFLITAGAAVLRFLFLTRKPFWFDECFSVEVARLSWSGFLHLLWWREANMSLYYLLLRGWLLFGASPFFIRSFSVLASLATLPAIYWLGNKLFDRRVGVIAAALFGCNAYSVRYAQEARSYSLFLLLATVASGWFVAYVRQSSRWNRRAYVLTSILAVYAHFYALLLIACHWLSLRGQITGETTENQSKVRLSAHRTWVAIGVAVAPLLVFVIKTGAGPIRWIQRPSAHELIEFFEHLAGNAGSPLLLLYVAAGLAAILPLKGRLLNPSADWQVWRIRFLLIWLFFPITLCVVLSWVRPVFLGRYFIFCLPALIILAAAGLATLRKAWMLGVCLAATMLLSLQGTFSYYDRDFDLQRDDSQAAANYVYDRAQPGDAILFHIAEARIPYEFFVSIREKDSPTGRANEPDIVFPRHGERLDYRDIMGNPKPEFLQSLSEKYMRIWVVLMSNETAGKPDATTTMMEQVMARTFPRSEEASFPQVEVWVYSK